MKRVTGNPLLLASLMGLALYWIIGAIAENPYVSSAASLAILIAGTLTLVRYAPAAYRVVVLGARSDDVGGEGSHLALYGATLLAAGASYTGLFGLLWIWFGQPVDWTGTATSAFGRAMMVFGFWLLYIGPTMPGTTPRAYSAIWLFSLVVIGMLIGVVAGMNLTGP